MNNAIGDIKAYLDLSGAEQTIRTSSCEVLVAAGESDRCSACQNYRKVLTGMLHRFNREPKDSDRSNPSSTTNYWYLTSPEKVERIRRLHSIVKVSQQC